MATQTLTITADANDGYGAGSWDNSAPNYLSVNEATGWSFAVTSQITAGSTISKAYFRCNTNATFTGTLTSTIAVENADPATNTVWSGSHLAASATVFAGATPASWNCVDFQNVWMFGESDNRPANITSGIQGLVDAFGSIDVGHIINIRHTATGAGGAYTEIESGGGTNQPELYIEWTPGAGVVDLASGATAGATASATLSVQRNLASAAVAAALASGGLSVNKALTSSAIGAALGSATLEAFTKVWRVPTNAPNGTAVKIMIVSGTSPNYTILQQGTATVAGGYADLPTSGTPGTLSFAFMHNYNDNTATTSIYGGGYIATLTAI